MNNLAKFGIALAITIATLAIIFGSIFIIGNGKVQHQNFCQNWKANLDTRQASLQDNIFRGDAEVAQYNAESAQYNKECAF